MENNYLKDLDAALDNAQKWYNEISDENEKEGKKKKEFFNVVKKNNGLNKLEIKFKKLDKDAVMPKYAHDGDVGMDLVATKVEYDKEKDLFIYHTGLSFETDKHYGILLFLRSSNRKTDAYMTNHVGIVDSALYRGEIMICLKNRTSTYTYASVNALNSFMSSMKYGVCDDNKNMKDIVNKAYDDAMLTKKAVLDAADELHFAPYQVGDRIAQMVVLPYPDISLIQTDTLSSTERQDGGFGSTGK